MDVEADNLKMVLMSATCPSFQPSMKRPSPLIIVLISNFLATVRRG